MASISRSFLSLLLLAPLAAFAQDIPQWLDVAASTEQNADKAKAANVDPVLATQSIIRGGDAAPAAVKAVAEAYDTCEALTGAVRGAVELAPGQAKEIVDAALDVEPCPCSDAQLWERSRLEQRIRVERRATPNAIAPGCECAASIAGALAVAIGGSAYGLVETALADGASCDCAGAAFAAVANTQTDSKAWIRDQGRALAAQATAGGAVVDMIGEVGPPKERQGALDTVPTPLVRTELSCSVTEGQDERFLRICTAANRFPLLIVRYATEGDRRGLEVVNVGKETIDLAAERLVLDVFSEGDRMPTRSVPLEGRLEPDRRLVVATPQPPRPLGTPQIATDELAKDNIDAVALRRNDDATAALACHASALAIAAANPDGPIIIGAAPAIPVEGDPRTDESPIDPNRGGDIASPN